MLKFIKKTYEEDSKMEKNVIQAVHDDDLIKLLTSLDVYDRVKNGREKCLFCSETITLENMASVFPFNNQVAFCCDKNSCYNQLIKRSER